MTDKDEEIHAELLRLFREYFKENQDWFNKDTYASTIRIRHLLSDIRETCTQRRKAIRLWQIDKRAQLDERKVRRAAQKKSGGESKDNN
jgi:hypothetical protein